MAVVGFDLHDRAEFAGINHALHLDERRAKAPIVTDAEHNAGIAARLDCARGINRIERKRFFAEHVLGVRRCRFDLGRMQRMRRHQNHGADRWIGERILVIASDRQLARGREFPNLLRFVRVAEDLAEPGAPAPNRRHVPARPPAKPDDGRIDHDTMTPPCDIMLGHRYNAPRPRSRADNNRVGHRSMRKPT